MPKNRKDKKERRGKRRTSTGRSTSAAQEASDDEDGEPMDACSVLSLAGSDHMSTMSDEDLRDVEEPVEDHTVDALQEKVGQWVDDLSHKSVKTRSAGLQGLKSVMSQKVKGDFFSERKVTILDSLERCLRKGRGEEQCLAACCASLFFIQLGEEQDFDLYKSLKPILVSIVTDSSMAANARSECASCLGLVTLLAANDELEVIQSVMESLESVFRMSYLKGDKTVPSHAPAILALHASALNAWGLLLTLLPQSCYSGFAKTYLSKLSELLQSTDVELRITAGEVLALIVELARMESGATRLTRDEVRLCELLRQMSTDGSKGRTKKDRRTQRASFRDILLAISEDERPCISVKFSGECLEIVTWMSRMHYNAFCHVLASGMNSHLQSNELIRDVFSLGPPLPSDFRAQRLSKRERVMENAAAFKARTIVRGKQRDKRTLSMDMS